MACDESVFQGDDNWGEQIKCLRQEVESLRGEIERTTNSAKSFSSALGSSSNIMKDMLNTIGDMRKRMYEFSKDTSQQYELAEQIAKSYKSVGLSIGLAVDRSKGFSQAFKGAVAEVARFGGDIEDVSRIYEDFADSSGRVRILGKDEVSNIFKLGKAANLVGSEASNLYETLELMGVSNVDATERLEQLIKDSQSIGLNSSKVMKVLSSNMNKMQTYSFSNGVKGMTKMSQLAVKMRMDVGEMLGMADKFYEPEAAIEAAANLQMLGGDIAQAFGDPFETMYLARNKPEELAEKVSGMVEGMMTLNQETGEYEFPAEARMQLKAAGDQLGINVDSMIEMTRQANKIKDVKNKLSTSGMFTDKEMEGIASMAKLEGGEFKVDMYDESGEKITKSIDQLTSGDVEMLMRIPQDEEDYMEKMIDNSMTTNEILKSIEDTFKKTFVEGFDMYQIIEDSSKETMKATRDMTMKSLEASMDWIKDSVVGQLGGLGADSMKKTDEAMAEYIRSLGDFLSEDADLDVDVENGIITITNVTDWNPSGGGGGGGGSASQEQIDKERCEGKPGRVYKNGKCYDSNNNEVTPFAKGGIVTKPTRALIGEAGEAEAVIPLTKLDDFISNQKMEFGNLNISGRLEIVSPDGSTSNLDMSSIKPQIEKMIINQLNGSFRNGGVTSSKERTDYMG
jgi:hypothetical protein